MKAVIMAGGQGSRLRPLTENVPKPMARLCGRPVVEYILELLAENGIFESVLTLQYLPERLTGHFEGAEFAGVKLSFCEEEAPLGTAGSVKNALGAPDGPALVISGDALCDFPLRQAVEAHRESGAAVTIVTCEGGRPRVNTGWSWRTKPTGSPASWKSPPMRRRRASLPTPASISCPPRRSI